MTKNYDEHESYGMIQISRVSGSKRNLFGSSICHSNTIALRIHKASVKRNLSSYWYHPKDTIVEIELSNTQFIDAMTNMNTSGTPATIRYIQGERTEDCPHENVKKVFEEELSNDIESVLSNTRKMMKLVETKLKAPGTMKKSDRLELAGILYKVEQDIRDNIHFVYRQFNKQMDKSITEAKGEIESFFTSTIHSLGSKELVKKLEDGSLINPLMVR